MANTINRPFKDGLCELWQVDRMTLKELKGRFYFADETIGIKSYTDFKTYGSEIERVISIPYNHIVDKANQVVKIGDTAYRIELIQKKDTFPVSLRLTLSKTQINYR